MNTFEDFLETMVEPEQQEKMAEILRWIQEHYQELDTRIAWNQPMFTHEETFIIGFSYSKKHISMAPEVKPIEKFKELIEDTGLSHTKNIIRIRWEDPIPYNLIKTLIEYNIEDKADYDKFWR